ncbi:MAG: YggS family pyridoxal phosphate-dependent enzyme [Saprospiraceae bacterium]
MLEQILEELKPYGARLVAVSKTKPDEAILDLYNRGHRIFGENKVQELVGKYERLPKDIEWHMIGRLQTNKVKYIVPFVSMIHSVDSLKLLREIDKRAGRVETLKPTGVDCLLQYHICTEETKHGMNEQESEELLKAIKETPLQRVRICGVMGMATFTDDMDLVRQEFRNLKKQFDYLKENHFAGQEHFREISMGMSGDYKVALEEGSTLVRIGTLLFGARQYT